MDTCLGILLEDSKTCDSLESLERVLGYGYELRVRTVVTC